MKNIFISICVLAALTSYVQAASWYRWVDKDGRVHYGDQPAEDAVGAEQKTLAAPAAAGEDDLSYSVRKAKRDFPVTLYVAPGCGDTCVQGRGLLNKRGIPFVEKNLESKEEIDQFKAKSGGDTVPVLAVGRSMISGFGAEQWNGELDIAGYPKTAPYGSRPALPATGNSEVAPETRK